jgi:hypothetical protein
MLHGPTNQTYNSVIKQYQSLIEMTNIGRNTAGNIFPATTEGLINFITFQRINKTQSIKSMVSAIRTFHKVNNLSTEAIYSDYITLFIKATTRDMKNTGDLQPRRDRRPIEMAHIKSIRENLDLVKQEDLTFYTITLIGFTNMMRTGELLPTQGKPFNEHLHPTAGGHQQNSDHAILHIPSTKTDLSGRGFDLVIPCIPTDGHKYCPSCHLAVLTKKYPATATNTHIFSIQGQPLHKDTYVQRLKAECKRIGLDPKFIGGHSLRIGGATACALANLSGAQIQMLGRWTSEAYILYLNAQPHDRIRILRNVMATAQTQPHHGACYPGPGPWDDRIHTSSDQ